MPENYSTDLSINDDPNSSEFNIPSSPIRSENIRNNQFNDPADLNDNHYYDGDEDLTTKLVRQRHERTQISLQPMSSPVRRRQSRLQSRALGEKYTLRTRNYIPFHMKQRDEKRAERALQQRGGNEQMERFLYIQDEKKWKDQLSDEADKYHILSINTIDESSDLSDNENDNLDAAHPQEPYEKELEEILQWEDEELDELLLNLKLS